MSLTDDAKNLPVLPKHVGIIMDGNGRWAKSRGLPRNFGHKAGAKTLKKIAIFCGDAGLEALTVYAFSTENWKRPKKEVDGIMSLLMYYLKNAEREIGGRNVRISVIGDRSMLSEEIREQIIRTEKLTEKNDGLVLTIALNYGGRAEIVKAVQKLAASGADMSKISEEDIEKELYTNDLPPVDMIIRPSGEYRLSNFLLWQSSYAEFWFSNILWPDFSEKDMFNALEEYSRRNRRFGASE